MEGTVPTNQQDNAIEIQTIVSKAKTFMESSKAKNTKRAYGNDWKDFSQWCRSRGFVSLPANPVSVILYVTELTDRCKVSTIQRRLSAISQAHKMAGHKSPTLNPQVRETMNGIKRTKGTSRHKKTALLIKDIKGMIQSLPDGLKGTRDRALLILGFASALRRSELVNLNVDDVQFNDDGLVITIRYSKTDQEGKGETVGIPYGSNRETCPVRSMKAWIEASGIESGALFTSITRHGRLNKERLSCKAIALVVKKTAEAAGLDASLYAAHSLRSGFATQADLSDAKFTDIKRQGRWKNDATVRGYMQRSNLFQSNAAAKLGL